MSEIIAFKTELAPNTKQRKMLSSNMGAARFTYNCLLNWTLEEYKKHKKDNNHPKPGLTLQTLQKVWTNKLRDIYAKEWWNDNESRAYRSGAEQLAKAYENWLRNNPKTIKGHPTWKSKGGKDSYTTDKLRLSEDSWRVDLPKCKNIKVKERLKAVTWLLKCGSSVQAITISKEPSGRYYISIRLRVPDKVALQFYKGKFTRKGNGFVGVDVGIKNYLTASDGWVVSNPKFLKNREKRLANAQRKFSCKYEAGKGEPKSNSYQRQKLAVARQHRKVRNARKDFTLKTSRYLVENNSTIVVESLDIKSLLEAKEFSKEISDASWGLFFSNLKYISKRYNTELVVADKYFPSTKKCSSCGVVKTKLPLRVRTYKCDKCGSKCDRDLNAALNLENWGREFLTPKDASRWDESLNGRGAPGYNRWGVRTDAKGLRMMNPNASQENIITLKNSTNLLNKG